MSMPAKKEAKPCTQRVSECAQSTAGCLQYLATLSCLPEYQRPLVSGFLQGAVAASIGVVSLYFLVRKNSSVMMAMMGEASHQVLQSDGFFYSFLSVLVITTLWVNVAQHANDYRKAMAKKATPPTTTESPWQPWQRLIYYMHMFAVPSVFIVSTGAIASATESWSESINLGGAFNLADLLLLVPGLPLGILATLGYWNMHATTTPKEMSKSYNEALNPKGYSVCFGRTLLFLSAVNALLTVQQLIFSQYYGFFKLFLKPCGESAGTTPPWLYHTLIIGSFIGTICTALTPALFERMAALLDWHDRSKRNDYFCTPKEAAKLTCGQKALLYVNWGMCTVYVICQFLIQWQMLASINQMIGSMMSASSMSDCLDLTGMAHMSMWVALGLQLVKTYLNLWCYSVLGAVRAVLSEVRASIGQAADESQARLLEGGQVEADDAGGQLEASGGAVVSAASEQHPRAVSAP